MKLIEIAGGEGIICVDIGGSRIVRDRRKKSIKRYENKRDGRVSVSGNPDAALRQWQQIRVSRTCVGHVNEDRRWRKPGH